MEQLTDRSKVTIKVHPEFLPIVEQHRDRFLQHSSSLKELRIEADPRVKLGGCLIETPGGEIDARIESQFAVIEHSLRNPDQAV
jgi:flagellar biosynthesis/type III secretory pathway protein FliH